MSEGGRVRFRPSVLPLWMEAPFQRRGEGEKAFFEFFTPASSPPLSGTGGACGKRGGRTGGKTDGPSSPSLPRAPSAFEKGGGSEQRATAIKKKKRKKAKKKIWESRCRRRSLNRA